MRKIADTVFTTRELILITILIKTSDGNVKSLSEALSENIDYNTEYSSNLRNFLSEHTYTEEDNCIYALTLKGFYKISHSLKDFKKYLANKNYGQLEYVKRNYARYKLLYDDSYVAVYSKDLLSGYDKLRAIGCR